MRGKEFRLKRLFGASGKMVMIPMDHGITLGPIHGIKNINEIVSEVNSANVDSVVLHKGMAACLDNLKAPTSLTIHVSASTVLGPDSLRKVTVCDVEEAIKLGADAVSTHINFGSPYEFEQIIDTANIAKECNRWDIPLVVMAYVRGQGLEEFNSKNLAHAVRISAEIGADVVKTNYTGNPDTFLEVVQASSLPVLIAGGDKIENEYDLFKMTEDSVSVGGAGVSFGRNVFGHESPGLIARELMQIVHYGKSAEEAINDLPRSLQKIY